jgi:broad specificity phosphatase PhoE
LSRVYLVRHGQAGTRQAYDSLSEPGRRQARLLGEHFVREGIRFNSVCTGALSRQQQTAAEVAAAYRESGIELPAPKLEPGWNEFDLDHVYNELAPVLCAEDAGFRREFEAMRTEIHEARDRHDADVHHRWAPCDVKIVQAWIRGHERFNGETWDAFRGRILGCRAKLPGQPAGESDDDRNIAVFTSATPIGIWAALAMDIDDHRAMRLAGVLQNASYTVMRLRGEQLRLHTFNAVQHLEPALRTYR